MAFDLGSFIEHQRGGKALPAIPQLLDPGVQVDVIDRGTFSGGGDRKRGRLSQREAARHIDTYGGRQAIDHVMNATRYTATTVAGAEYHFEPKRKPGERRLPGDAAVTVPDALLELFDQPNPYMDYVELLELLVIDLLLVGNAYWYKWRSNKAGQPLAIYRLAPPNVEVQPKPWGVGGYTYKIDGMQPLDMQPQEVIHFKLANPHSPYYGLGLIQGAGRAGDLELALTDTQASYMENHAMPSLAVQSERRVPRDVFKKIRAQLRARTQGPRNAGDILVLEAGLKLAPLSPNASQAAFVELSRMTRDRILSWFHLSPKLLGILDEAGGADKIADAERIFAKSTVRPLMNKLQRKISRELSQAWDLDYQIDYEYQMSPEDLFRLVGQVAQTPGITVDEIRSYARLGPHPDKTIGTMTLNLPGAEAGTGQPGDPTRQGFPDRPLTSEPGRPPKPSNTRAFPRAGAPLPAGAKARPGVKALEGARSVDDILAGIEAIAAERKALDSSTPDTRLPGEQRPDDRLSTRRTADVDAIAADLHADLADAAVSLERGILDHVEGKAMSNLVQRVKRSETWRVFQTRVTDAIERAVRRALSAAVVHHGTVGLTPESDIDYDALAKQVVHRRDGAARIVGNVKEALTKQVKEARDAGKSADEINAVIQSYIKDWQEGGAEGVGITEVTRAYNLGTLEVAEATGSTHVGVVDGDDHDEPCKEADGAIWPIDQARERLVEHPRCRRAFTPIPQEAV
jgi:HK97 family phage portal protein